MSFAPTTLTIPEEWKMAVSVDHIGIGASDYEKSKAFYAAALAPLKSHRRRRERRCAVSTGFVM